jgi:hypothetical protein
MIEIERVWTKHVDGVVCCGFGVFPCTDAWEVWHYHDGEWRPFRELQPFASFEAAKLAALREIAKMLPDPGMPNAQVT